MGACTNNFEVVRGDTWTLALTFKDKDSNPIDITGSTIYLTVKAAVTDTDDNAVISHDVTSHVDAVNGLSAVTATHAETATLNIARYYYDVVWKTATGTVTTLVLGHWQVNQDITTRE